MCTCFSEEETLHEFMMNSSFHVLSKYMFLSWKVSFVSYDAVSLTVNVSEL